MTPNLLAQSIVQGMVLDKENELEEGVVLTFYKNGILQGMIKTDSNGLYRMKLDQGTYHIEFSKVGFPTVRLDNLILFEEMEQRIDFKFEEFYWWEMIVTGIFYPLLFDENKISSTKTFSSERIIKQPTRKIDELVSSVAGVSILK